MRFQVKHKLSWFADLIETEERGARTRSLLYMDRYSSPFPAKPRIYFLFALLTAYQSIDLRARRVYRPVKPGPENRPTGVSYEETLPLPYVLTATAYHDFGYWLDFSFHPGRGSG